MIRMDATAAKFAVAMLALFLAGLYVAARCLYSSGDYGSVDSIVALFGVWSWPDLLAALLAALVLGPMAAYGMGLTLVYTDQEKWIKDLAWQKQRERDKLFRIVMLVEERFDLTAAETSALINEADRWDETFWGP